MDWRVVEEGADSSEGKDQKYGGVSGEEVGINLEALQHRRRTDENDGEARDCYNTQLAAVQCGYLLSLLMLVAYSGILRVREERGTQACSHHRLICDTAMFVSVQLAWIPASTFPCYLSFKFCFCR